MIAESGQNVAEGSAEALSRAIALADSLPVPDSNQEAIDALYQIAALAENLGQFEVAQARYQCVLDCVIPNPSTNVAAHYRRGICLERMGDSALAIEQLELAARKSAAWPEVGRLARWELTGILLRTEDFETVERHCRVLLEEPDCDPLNRTEVRARWARCLFSLNHPEATSAWLEICEVIPHIDLAASSGLVSSLFETAVAVELTGEYSLASRFYSLVLEKKDLARHTIASAAYRLAICMEQSCRWMESMTHYRTAIDMGEGLPEVPTLARIQLGLLLLAAEEYAAAAELYSDLCEEPSELHIPLAEAYYRLAFCLFRGGDGERARLALNKIPQTGATEELVAKADELLAEIFESRKEYQSAEACYRRLIANAEAEIPVKVSALHRITMLRALNARA